MLVVDGLRPIGLDNFLMVSLRFPTGAKVHNGAVAQLGERLICIQEVAGSIPTSSTSSGESAQPSAISCQPKAEGE